MDGAVNAGEEPVACRERVQWSGDKNAGGIFKQTKRHASATRKQEGSPFYSADWVSSLI